MFNWFAIRITYVYPNAYFLAIRAKLLESVFVGMKKLQRVGLFQSPIRLLLLPMRVKIEQARIPKLLPWPKASWYLLCCKFAIQSRIGSGFLCIPNILVSELQFLTLHVCLHVYKVVVVRIFILTCLFPLWTESNWNKPLRFRFLFDALLARSTYRLGVP